MRWLTRKLVLGALVAAAAFVPPALAAQDVAALLRQGDTAQAIAVLRRAAQDGPADQQCLLATLLTHHATAATADWRERHEAERLFHDALVTAPTPGCYLAYAALKQKQGMWTDAGRMLDRADGLLPAADDAASRVIRAEILYRRAVLLDDWLRNFDYLVNAPQLAVSTPGCIYSGYFCENFTTPRDFNARLAAAPSTAGVADDDRRQVIQVLDSALVLHPTHPDARRLRLRRALVAADWAGFARIAAAWVGADSTALAAWLAVLAAEVQRGAYSEASETLRRVDSLIPDSTRAVYERLATVAGEVDLMRADAVWSLSDPLYLTPANERRVQHYARMALADIAFSDPDQALLGRDTQAGMLVLRYGWPKHISEVPRDGTLELDPENLRAVIRILHNVPPDLSGAQRAQNRASGRWTFFNYDPAMPSFVFERSLTQRTSRYKLITRTDWLDSTLARVAPSTFESPYVAGHVTALVTRFPRPTRPVVEVGARFSWPGAAASHDSVQVGVFVHDLRSGHAVNRGVSRRVGRDSVRFAAALPVVWGRLQLAVEGMTAGPAVAAFQRTTLTLNPPDTALTLSDLLLGETLDAPDLVDRREQVRLRARVDSLPAPGAPLALYWETYGLTPDTAGVTRATITLRLDDVAGGRSPGGEVLRVLGRLVSEPDADVLTWTRDRPAGGEYVPDVVLLRLPDATGSYRITVEVQDRVSGRTARNARVVTLAPPGEH